MKERDGDGDGDVRKGIVELLYQYFLNRSLPKMYCHAMIAYLWLSGSSYTTIMNQTTHSSTTVSVYLNFFRQLVSETLQDDDELIGGPGIIVEIDESKLGKRKYHRGHRVEGVWVLGGIERKGQKRSSWSQLQIGRLIHC